MIQIFRNIKYWFKFHFNKKTINLYKTVWNSFPWDYAYLYELEKAKLEQMIEYHERTQRYVGVEYDIRDMKICVGLLKIILGEVETHRYDHKNPPPDGKYNSIRERLSDLVYIPLIHMNLKNIDRFVHDEKLKEYYKSFPDDFYILKAKRLYHKIRDERDNRWAD